MDMTPMANNQMPSQSAPKKSTNVILIILVVVLVLGNAATAYFLFKKSSAANDANQEQTENLNNQALVEENTNSSNQDQLDNNPENSMPGDIVVSFNDWPIIESVYNFFDYELIDQLLTSVNVSDSQADITVGDIFSRFNVYKVGKISSGIYVGKDLFIVRYQPEGPTRPSTYRVIKNDQELMLIVKHSNELFDDPILNKIFTKYPNINISGLETPDIINIPDRSIHFKLLSQEPYLLVSEYLKPKKLFQYNGKDYIYKDEQRNCFFVRAADGTAREYYLELPFLSDSSYPVNAISRAAQTLNITFSDSSQNKNKYSNADPVGCGVGSCYNYAYYINNIDQLKEIASSSQGDKFYELKDINTKAQAADKNSVLKDIYDFYYPGYDEKTNKQLPKMSFEQFLSEHPLLFWQDPFGNFMVFKAEKFLPAVECGKPVIYLYPTKTTNVSVKVNPTGGFTKTEPVYGNGWWVKAEPNGNLYNYQDQKNYPYLFWEGYALNYEQPQEGFVVAKSEVKKFLAEKLASQGLNAKEIADFMEFWLPRMQADPYYFVTFVPQAEFDKLAPLQVSPQPDTVIRVFMDYQPLSAPIKVSEQKLSTPKRQGFTVVEWGGALHQ